MIINEEENVWAHARMTDRHASDFLGMPARYQSQSDEVDDDFLRLDYPGEKGREVRIRIPKSYIARHGWIHIMPFLKQHLGFFAEDINTHWVMTDDSKLMPDPMDF